MKLKNSILLLTIFVGSVNAGQIKEVPSLTKQAIDSITRNFVKQYNLLFEKELSFKDLGNKFKEFSQSKGIPTDLYEKLMPEVIHQIIFLNGELPIDQKMNLYSEALESFGPYDLFDLGSVLTSMESNNIKTVTDVTPDGKTILLFAVQGPENTTLIRYLINLGANVNAGVKDEPAVTLFNPLHSAIFRGRIATIKTLIESGADINARNLQGNALKIVVNPGLGMKPEDRIEAIKLILQKNPKLFLLEEVTLKSVKDLDTKKYPWAVEAKKLIEDYIQSKKI